MLKKLSFRFLCLAVTCLVFVGGAFAQRGTGGKDSGGLSGNIGGLGTFGGNAPKGSIIFYPMPGAGVSEGRQCTPKPNPGDKIGLECTTSLDFNTGKSTTTCVWGLKAPNGSFTPIDEGCITPKPIPGSSVAECTPAKPVLDPTAFCDCIGKKAGEPIKGGNDAVLLCCDLIGGEKAPGIGRTPAKCYPKPVEVTDQFANY